MGLTPTAQARDRLYFTGLLTPTDFEGGRTSPTPPGMGTLNRVSRITLNCFA